MWIQQPFVTGFMVYDIEGFQYHSHIYIVQTDKLKSE